MLRQMLEWRRLNKVDGMLETWTPPEVMRKYYSAGFSGQDKDGCPGNFAAVSPLASIAPMMLTSFLLCR